VARWGLLLVLPGLWAATLAQEPPVPAEEPAVPAEESAVPEEPAALAEPPDEEQAGKNGKKMPFGLWVGVAYGSGEIDDIEADIYADNLNFADSVLKIDDALYGRAAIGWKLPHGKGDFRLIFQGVKEEEYEFSSVGNTNRTPEGISLGATTPYLPWWFVTVDDGDLHSVRLVPMWDSNSDEMYGNGDGVADWGPCTAQPDGIRRCGEIFYDTNSPDREVTGTLNDDLQNRINTYDIIYGREFGGRRYSSRWWGGLRYFEYDGQVLGGAWLKLGGSAAGEHFTDGSWLRLLRITQEASGFGPIGSWEADFNFYDRGLQLFIRGEAAFTFNSLEMDSGPFFHVLNEQEGSTLNDRMAKSQDKSSWQNKLEIGSRVNLKNGLQFEVAYSIAGYLDVILLPDLLLVDVSNENTQTFTQDILYESVHFGASYQF
jgi:hypothetical protein